MRERISVIVPVYNVERYLTRCVDSVLGQSYEDFELLLIDDGSTDGSGRLCDALRERDDRIRVFHKSNGGLSDARNYGLDRAEGEEIFLLDSDDYITPDALEVLHGLLRRYDAEEAIGGVADLWEGDSLRKREDVRLFLGSGVEIMGMALGENDISASACGKLMRRETLTGQRFPVGKIFEDAFFFPGYMFPRKKVVATTQTVYAYFHRRDSITTKPFSPKDMETVEAYEYTYRFVREHCPEILPEAECRRYWAHFLVLDKLMATEAYETRPEYERVLRFLRVSYPRILACPYLTKSRRLAASALMVHPGLYRRLSSAYAARRQANG